MVRMTYGHGQRFGDSQRERGVRQVEVGRGRVNGNGRDFALGDECMMQ